MSSQQGHPSYNSLQNLPSSITPPPILRLGLSFKKGLPSVKVATSRSGYSKWCQPLYGWVSSSSGKNITGEGIRGSMRVRRVGQGATLGDGKVNCWSSEDKLFLNYLCPPSRFPNGVPGPGWASGDSKTFFSHRSHGYSVCCQSLLTLWSVSAFGPLGGKG